MLERITDYIYEKDLDALSADDRQFFEGMDALAEEAFVKGDETARLNAHRVLYTIYMAHLAVPWERSPINLTHPLITGVRHTLEKKWDAAEREKYRGITDGLPAVDQFPKWVNAFVDDHPKNVIHPIFPFLRDEATFEQLREFFLQETPLEMLFGDIMALMLPGVYGAMKCEVTQNFWDEAGHAKETSVHRYLRGQIMDYLKLPQECYVTNVELFVTEELELINTYLGTALTRTKLGQLVGALLATELMIPNRFVYQIEGWRRHGVADADIKYLTDHVTVDVKHAQDWLDLVVSPLLSSRPEMMEDIMIGCVRRLDVAHAVCDRLMVHIQTMTVGSLGDYPEESAARMTA